MAKGDLTPGRRRRYDPTTTDYDRNGNPLDAAPGDYWLDYRNEWRGVAPNGHRGNLSRHQVVEHDDATITVSPSIQVLADVELWHGYLEHGVWREV